MRRRQYIITLCLTVLVATGVYQGSKRYFLSEELSKVQGRLSLYRSSVAAEFERYAHLPYILARDPFVMRAVASDGPADLNPRLEEFASQAGLDAIYFMELSGLTVAASNYRSDRSFVGQNYAFRPYFQTARAGQQGRYYAIGATTGLPGYFIADPVRDGDGAIAGVIAIKIDLSKFEASWRQSGEQVLLANRDGVVLLASKRDWQYKTLAPLTQEQRETIVAARQFSGQALAPLDWSDLPGNWAQIDGLRRIHVSAADLPDGWTLHYFASDDQVVARSWLVTASIVLLAGLVLIFLQIQRTRRVGVALARSEMEEAALRQANERLAVEIEDRKTAERRLRRTQNELERTGRLAALGKLSASVTHELVQPIAAMRNHLAAADLGAQGQDKLPQKIGELVDRMEGVTRQLKFFARSEGETFAEVDLCEALRASLTLVQPNLDAASVPVHVDLPDAPIIVRANKLRIEQVMVNLLRNAVDAVEGTDAPSIKLRAGQSQQAAWFEIRDNGHGLGQSTLAELQEPFVTTRESGRGMGLGLAISASIVADHDGTMTAENANGDGDGAIFRVSFPLPDQDEGPER